jgi:putative Mg2+ transporter-C (MgtC) family protein
MMRKNNKRFFNQVLYSLRLVKGKGMDIFWQALESGLPDTKEEFVHVIIRIIAAALLGAIVGIQRERAGKPAGLRTHILVCLGTTVFVLSCSEVGMSLDGLSRVIQGIITGIGFIGAGSILKLDEKGDIQGLTTAAGIWMMAAVGAAVGLGSLGVAVLSTLLTLIVLAVVGSLERRSTRASTKKGNSGIKTPRAKSFF